MRTGMVATLVVAYAALAGCAREVGMGLPVPISGEAYPGERMELAGVLEVTNNGCFELVVDGASHFVIWPAGSALADRVRLPSGHVVREGQTVIGRGGLTPTAPLVVNRDSYWAFAIGFCAPGATEVLVLDTAELAR